MNISQLKTIIHNFFNKGHVRTLKAKKQILLSYIFQGIDLSLGFFLIRLVLNYLDAERYGIWLVLFSFTTWFNIMDVGLAQGLRNKFAESVAKNKLDDARYYVSTAYAIIILISSIFFGIFLCFNHFIDWTRILNTSVSLKNELSILALFMFGSFSLTFVLKIITTLLVAEQKPSILYFKNLLEKISKVIIVLFLINTTDGSLLRLGISYSIVPVVILLILTTYYFSTEMKYVRPSFKYVNISYLKDIMGLGWKFFIIQIAVVVLFATDNIIITQFFGPDQVTSYEISKKYFSIPLMLFVVLIQPLWSSVTEAYHQNDYKWIERSIRKLLKIWGGIVLITVLMLGISDTVYKIWLGDTVVIPFQLSVCWMIFIIMQTFNQIFTSFINGVGKIKIQVFTAINTIIINIPLSILFAKIFGLGVSGVLLATIISISISIVVRIIQYNKIITGKANGIWNE